MSNDTTTIIKLLEQQPMSREEILDYFTNKAHGNIALNQAIIEERVLFQDDKFILAKKIPKYRNKKTIVDGIEFDSIKEAQYYQELLLLQKSGEIKDLELQPKFELLPSVKWNGKTYGKRSYIADFMFKEDDKTVVVDVKSEITRKNPVYTLKKQMFLLRYPQYEFREV